MEEVNCPPKLEEGFPAAPHPLSGLPDPESNFPKAGGLIHLAEVMGKGSEGLALAPGDRGLEYVQVLAGKLLGDESSPTERRALSWPELIRDRRGRPASEVVSLPSLEAFKET